MIKNTCEDCANSSYSGTAAKFGKLICGAKKIGRYKHLGEVRCAEVYPNEFCDKHTKK